MMRRALFVAAAVAIAAIAHAQAPIYNKGPAYNPASVAETGGTIDGVAFGGTVAADQAAAGKIGEYQEVNCGIPAASGTTVAFTNASPTVDHRHHRAGRLLSRRAARRQGLRSARRRAPHLAAEPIRTSPRYPTQVRCTPGT
jgi:hypothetical protein